MWQIQQVIQQRAVHQNCWVSRTSISSTSCTPIASSSNLYWAKRYTASTRASDFEYFSRQAALGMLVRSSSLVPMIDCDLDSSNPLIVYRPLEAQSLRHWLAGQGQAPSHSVLVWIVRQIVDALEAIHHAGFTHGQIIPEHIMITNTDYSVRVVGLGSLEPVGSISSLPRLSQRFDAPELNQNEFEVSTASDIYSVGQVMIELFGSTAKQWPIVAAMTSASADHRPTASELLNVLRDLERRLFGESISAKSGYPHQNAA